MSFDKENNNATSTPTRRRLASASQPSQGSSKQGTHHSGPFSSPLRSSAFANIANATPQASPTNKSSLEKEATVFDDDFDLPIGASLFTPPSSQQNALWPDSPVAAPSSPSSRVTITQPGSPNPTSPSQETVSQPAEPQGTTAPTKSQGSTPAEKFAEGKRVADKNRRKEIEQRQPKILESAHAGGLEKNQPLRPNDSLPANDGYWRHGPEGALVVREGEPEDEEGMDHWDEAPDYGSEDDDEEPQEEEYGPYEDYYYV